MRENKYDLFKGSSQQNAVWIEAVEGLQAATDRMCNRARVEPGDYFLFFSGNVVASVETEKNSFQPETLPTWKIGIVSSDSHHVDSVETILKKQQLKSVCATTVRQYRDELSKGPIDLVFCDPNLPDGDYKDVINATRLAASRARVVVTSGMGDWPQFLDVVRAGAFDLISKPCRSKDVEWMVIQAKRDDRNTAKQLMASNLRSRARGAA